MQTKLFSGSLIGNTFTSDSARQTIISSHVMRDLGITSADSAIGQSIILSVKVSTIDSALSHIVVHRGESILDHIKKIEFDSLFGSKYRMKVLREGINEVISRFVNGFMTAQTTVAETLTICGVRELTRAGSSRIGGVLVPVNTASRFRSSGFSGSPTELISLATSGSFSLLGEQGDNKFFSQVTVDFDPKVPYKSVKDSVEALGYRTFSFAAEFEQIQQVFFYFDLGLGVIGLLALITASLGIVNTMVMSILERRKEIGILKSLGADDRDIRFLFLVESGVIGLLGTWAGIFTGWVITRIISAIAQHYMEKEGIPAIDLFALPLWLILAATAIGLSVSVAAGLYPASRAARIDPVEALRND
jgi:ABC-type antimicrobial peptide transport system permease subunit